MDESLESDAATPLVRLRGVFKSYGSGALTAEVLKGVDLDLVQGEFAVIFGPSGCGKTTLLNIIGALDAPTSGSVLVDGHELSRMSRAELTEFRRGKVGFVFQSYNLIPTLTAVENVEAALELLPFSSRREMRGRAVDYLRRVGLGARGGAFPDHLSGGEQQRVAIARALAKQPLLVLADEPTGNLDEAMGMRILDLMRELNAAGATFVVVSHNPRVAERADRLVRLSDGKIAGASRDGGDGARPRPGHRGAVPSAPDRRREPEIRHGDGAPPAGDGSDEKADP
ncbi:MAG: ABC transporter ATP-binding protein [bacterium]|nr:ABC transporter ATP-binding protein [bacterium]